jgi:hypothetical protein
MGPPNDKRSIRRARVENPVTPWRRFRQTERGSIGFCLVRVIWLTAIFARRESVTITEYRRRFGVSLRSFHRDLALVRQAGFYLETAAPGDYRVVCFARDFDAV